MNATLAVCLPDLPLLLCSAQQPGEIALRGFISSTQVPISPVVDDWSCLIDLPGGLFIVVVTISIVIMSLSSCRGKQKGHGRSRGPK